MRFRFCRLAIESLEKRIVLDAMGPVAPPTPPAWESVIVQLKDNVSKSGIVTQGLMSEYGGELGHVYEHAIKGFAAQLPGAAVEGLRLNPWVKNIEADLAMHAFGQVTPTGLDRIDADLSSIAKIDGVNDPLDVNIAIIDSGIDMDHPDLNVVGGVRFYTVTNGRNRGSFEDTNFDDDNGHGTHVAGTAAAVDNDIGVVGAAPGARLWGVKVLNSAGSGYVSDIIKGIDWVTKNASTIDVANMSLGGLGSSSIYHAAIKASVNAGVVYVVASGNDYRDILGSDLTFDTADDTIPAAYPEVATISAFADSDGRAGGLGPFVSGYADDTYADFSNYSNEAPDGISWYDNPANNPIADLLEPGKLLGAGIDLAMPGVNIYSTYKGGGYATMSGTSMAAPHAAGLAALYIAKHGRDVNGDTKVNADDVYAIRRALIDSGKKWRDADFGLEYNVLAGTSDSPDNREENLGWVGDTRIVLTSPSNGAVVAGTVTIVANAAADVQSVEFFVNEAPIAVDTNGLDGWSTNWNASELAGNFTLVAAAKDGSGSSVGSDSIEVTVDNSVPTMMYVADLAGSSEKQGKRNWTAHVDILIQDSLGKPVANATVTGAWSQGSSGSTSSLTNSQGIARISKTGLSLQSTGSVTFTVTNVTGALNYDFGQNVESTIVIIRPN